MTTRKPAAKKAAATPSSSSTRTSRPSQAARIDALEAQVGLLAAQVDNLAKFIAAGVAQQLQAQLMGSPELQAQFAALASQQAEAGRP